MRNPKSTLSVGKTKIHSTRFTTAPYVYVVKNIEQTIKICGQNVGTSK